MNQNPSGPSDPPPFHHSRSQPGPKSSSSRYAMATSSMSPFAPSGGGGGGLKPSDGLPPPPGSSMSPHMNPPQHVQHSSSSYRGSPYTPMGGRPPPGGPVAYGHSSSPFGPMYSGRDRERDMDREREMDKARERDENPSSTSGGGRRYRDPSVRLASPRLSATSNQPHGLGNSPTIPTASMDGRPVMPPPSGSSSTNGEGARPGGGPVSGSNYNALTSRMLPNPFDRQAPMSPQTLALSTSGGGRPPPGSGKPPSEGPGSSGGGMKLSSLLGPGGSNTSSQGRDRPGVASLSPNSMGAMPSAPSSSAAGQLAPSKSYPPYDSRDSEHRAQRGMDALRAREERELEQQQQRQSSDNGWERTNRGGGKKSSGDRVDRERERRSNASTPLDQRVTSRRQYPSNVEEAMYPASAGFKVSSPAAADAAAARHRDYPFGPNGPPPPAPLGPHPGSRNPQPSGYDYPSSSTAPLPKQEYNDRLPPPHLSSGSPMPPPVGMIDRERDLVMAKDRERERARRELIDREKDVLRNQNPPPLNRVDEREMRELYEKERREIERSRQERAYDMAIGNRSGYGHPVYSGTGPSARAAERASSEHRRRHSGGYGLDTTYGGSGPAGTLDRERESVGGRDRHPASSHPYGPPLPLSSSSSTTAGGHMDTRRDMGPMDHGRSSASKQAIEVLNRPPPPPPPPPSNSGASAPLTAYPGVYPRPPLPYPPGGPRDGGGSGGGGPSAGLKDPSSKIPTPPNERIDDRGYIPTDLRHAKHEYDPRMTSNPAAANAAAQASIGNGVPSSSGGRATGNHSHKRKRSQAYAFNDTDRPEAFEDKVPAKKRSSKHSHAHHREYKDHHPTAPPMVHPSVSSNVQSTAPIASHLPRVDYGLLSLPPVKNVDVRSESVESCLRALGMDVLMKHLGRVIYRGHKWMLDLDLLANHIGGTLEIFIPGAFLPSGPRARDRAWVVRGEKGWDDAVTPIGKHVIATLPGVAQRQLWGTDIFTDDSDLLAVLLHSSWLRPLDAAFMPPPPSYEQRGEPVVVQQRNGQFQDDLKVVVRAVPRLTRYIATQRGGIYSRGWGNSHDGVSFVVESVERVKRGKALSQSRKTRKSRIDANLLQRRIVFGQSDFAFIDAPPGAEGTTFDLEFDDGAGAFCKQTEMTFLRSGDLGHAYDPALLSSWNLPLDGETTSRDAQPSDEVQQRPVASAGPTAAASALQGAGVDSRTGIKKNIWIRDLLLENNGETYRLTTIKDASPINPLFCLKLVPSSLVSEFARQKSLTKKPPQDDDTSPTQTRDTDETPRRPVKQQVVLADKLTTDDLGFTPQGLVVRQSGSDTARAEHDDDAWLCVVERFAWAQKEKMVDAEGGLE